MFLWRKTGAPFDASAVVVLLYSKPGCHLCDEAKAQLTRLRQQYGFQLQEMDISRDPALLAEYEMRIPLIWVDGRLACKYRVDERALLKRLRRAVLVKA